MIGRRILQRAFCFPHTKVCRSHTTTLYRLGLLLHYAGLFGHAGVEERALQLFQVPAAVPVDVRQAVYYIGVARGDADAYLHILRLYNTTNVAAEQAKCLIALSGTQDPALVSYTLRLILDVRLDYTRVVLTSKQATVIRPQDGGRLMRYLASTSVGNAYLVWDFFKANFNEFQSR